ncbi:MAG: pitrilysin family protein, partial [Woeseiaceae bacterium]|nr:pitrilysin family protein [Woeseiaceae bacterium]MDX2608092.1 pitrilysin family protein [Woeseiaceae bacterium]
MQFTRIAILTASLVMAISGCQSKDPSETVEAVAALPEGITLLETVEKGSAGGIVIPYRKYELDNGLTVVLHEDLSDPLVHVDITYHVGSGREEVGKSGFAHFFEHMMFQGSENVDDEEHIKIVSESGGTLNGSTNTDRTNYFETAPANQLEKMLWLEADRMGFFLDAVTQEKFEVQRETVKNERGQNYDNRPYGRLNERVNEALYPEGHPYSWLTIGYIEDLNRVTVSDLKQFFLRWYGPNNATLTIGGKFDESETLAWINKYFGSIPRGPEVANPEKPVVTLESDRYLSMEDNVALPLLYMAFPTVHLYHEDEAPLDVLMYVLGQGETSLLYKNVVKNGLAVNASAGHGCQELSCTFTVFALPNPASGTTLADLERIVRASLDEFETRGVVDDDLERVKMDIVSGMIYSLESVAGKVGTLASHQTYTGNPNFTGGDIARYENVTKEDVMRVYRQYIKGKSAVVMSIVPPGQMSMIAREDTWSRFERDLPDYKVISEEDLAFRRAMDDFDRSVMPPSGDNPTVVLPDIWRAELDNGIEVLGAVNSETPTVAIQLRIEAGQRSESLDKLGLAAMTAAMLNESTTQRTNEELSNELQKLGATVQFGAGNDNTILTIRSLSEHLDETLAIAAERLLQPKFDEDDFERVKAQTLQAIRQGKKQPATTAATVYQMLLYGRDNSFSYLNIGTEESVVELTLDDVKGFYADNYSPTIASIVAVSDQAQDVLVKKLSVFENWEGSDVIGVGLNEFPEIGETRIYLVDKPGAAQSEIRIGKRALTFDATGDYYRANLMNFTLGGAFNSRIMLNLREEKGYTYGAFSGFNGTRDYGAFTAQAAVRTDTTGDSIVQFENEIRGYAESGISETELAFTRRAIGQRDARSYETPA